MSRRVARGGGTYVILVTLLTSHWPMSWSKATAELNMPLYADTQQRSERRSDTSSAHGTWQWCGVQGRERIMR